MFTYDEIKEFVNSQDFEDIAWNNLVHTPTSSTLDVENLRAEILGRFELMIEDKNNPISFL